MLPRPGLSPPSIFSARLERCGIVPSTPFRYDAVCGGNLLRAFDVLEE